MKKVIIVVLAAALLMGAGVSLTVNYKQGNIRIDCEKSELVQDYCMVDASGVCLKSDNVTLAGSQFMQIKGVMDVCAAANAAGKAKAEK